MKSYFFVPANRLHKIPQVRNLQVDEVIIDMEDAIKASEIDKFIEDLIANDSHKQYYLRLNILNDDLDLDLTHFDDVFKNGFTKFVLPKIQNISQLRDFFSRIKSEDCNFILLVETPRLFIQLNQVFDEFSDRLFGVGLGSHDLLSNIGALHNLNNLEYARQSMLYTARAFGIEVIDIASMNLNDAKAFNQELMDGFEKGYDAKFIIHPWQLEILQEIPFYTNDDLNWAKSIYEILKDLNFDINEFNAIKIGDQIVEKPHVKRALKIIDYFKKQS